MSEYNKTIQRYLDEWGVKFSVKLIGDACPPFCEDKGKPGIGEFPRKTHIHGQHWRYTFYRQGKDNLSSEFWDSYHTATRRAAANGWARAEFGHRLEVLECSRKDRRLDSMITPEVLHKYRNDKPTPYDVLSCIEKSDPGTPFEEWAVEVGYDPDSRRGERIYRAVCEEWAKVRRFFTEEELEVLREIAT